MAVSRKRKKGQDHLNQFKQKKMSEDKKTLTAEAVAKTQNHFLVPQAEWQTTDVLDLRGDLLEALEDKVMKTYGLLQQSLQEFNNLAKIIQMIQGNNIKAGKAKLTYKWADTGEEATEEEVKEFETQQKKFQEEYQKILDEQKIKENAGKTGLVGPDGEAIGTTQNLEEEPLEKLPDGEPTDDAYGELPDSTPGPALEQKEEELPEE